MRNSMLIHPEELSKKWIDRLADEGIGAIGIHPRGGKHAVNSLKELLEQMKRAEYRELIDYAKSRGLEVEYELHAAGYLLPRELFEGNPELFRMNENGERTADYNLCVSNGEALDLCAQRAAELASSLYGSAERFYFWMDDGHGLSCSCPSCKKISPSDQQLIVTNRMARAIRRYIPNARVAYLAYMDSVECPTRIAPTEGVFLEYAPFEKYTAKGDNAAELIKREREALLPLMRFFDREPKKVLEYWYDNSMFSKWKKPPKEFTLNETEMRKDIAEYKELGFDGVSTFACFLGNDYEELYGDVDIKPFADVLMGTETEKE